MEKGRGDQKGPRRAGCLHRPLPRFTCILATTCFFVFACALALQKGQLESAAHVLETQRQDLEKEKSLRLWHSVRRLARDLQQSVATSQRRMEKIENSEIFGPDIRSTPDFKELAQLTQELWERDRNILRHPMLQNMGAYPAKGGREDEEVRWKRRDARQPSYHGRL